MERRTEKDIQRTKRNKSKSCVLLDRALNNDMSKGIKGLEVATQQAQRITKRVLATVGKKVDNRMTRTDTEEGKRSIWGWGRCRGALT